MHYCTVINRRMYLIKISIDDLKKKNTPEVFHRNDIYSIHYTYLVLSWHNTCNLYFSVILRDQIENKSVCSFSWYEGLNLWSPYGLNQKKLIATNIRITGEKKVISVFGCYISFFVVVTCQWDNTPFKIIQVAISKSKPL